MLSAGKAATTLTLGSAAELAPSVLLE